MNRSIASGIKFGMLAVAGMLLVVGCGNKSSSTPISSSVTDVSTPSPAYTAPPPMTTSAQPSPYDTMPNTSTASNSNTAMGSGSYTVKRGDTLYSIARTHYGDGKQWQKIASANPGVRPESLKVGQTITIP